MAAVTVTVEAATPPKRTVVCPATKFAPFSVTCVPARPSNGVKESTRGGTVNKATLEAVAPAVTLMDPVTASAGTTALMRVLLTMSKEAGEEFPNFTCVALRKPVPLIVTVVPGAPLVGEKFAMLCALTRVPVASHASARQRLRSVGCKRNTGQTESDSTPTGKPADRLGCSGKLRSPCR